MEPKEIIDHIRAEEDKSKSTSETYLKALEQLCEVSEKDPEEVTELDAKGFILWMKGNGYKKNTQKAKTAALRKIFAWMKNKGIILEDPFRNIQPIREEIRVPMMPTPEEVRQMIAALNLGTFVGRRNAAIIVFLADTGVRREELRNIKVRDITRSKKNFVLNTPLVKGSNQRMIPFGEIRENYLVSEIWTMYWQEITYVRNYGPDDFVFRGQDRTMPISPQVINNMLRSLCVKLNIGPYSPHSFRHYFATYSVMNGQTVQAVQALLGHRFIETTMRYIHYANVISGDSLMHNPTRDVKALPGWSGFTKTLVKK